MAQQSDPLRPSHASAIDDPARDRLKSGPFNPATASSGQKATGTVDAATSAAADELKALRRELDGVRASLSAFISDNATRATSTARIAVSRALDQSSAVAADLAEAGADLASDAAGRAKGVAAELEQVARRNPLSAIAAAAAIGLLIGMMGRRR